MFRLIGVWVILSIAIGFTIAVWREASGKERWQLTKTFAYAIMCSLIAVLLLSAIVVIF